MFPLIRVQIIILLLWRPSFSCSFSDNYQLCYCLTPIFFAHFQTIFARETQRSRRRDSFVWKERSMSTFILHHWRTSAKMVLSPTLIWCFLMPSIHLFSLLSNILCIIVFCSKTFIKKPIAIYFIFLLISDSITLLIGYIEMIDRESNMIDKSSWLCTFNEKIIHRLVDFVYGFMERFCLEWMLYKVLWTRVSTILLAVLSVQRSRTFFSLAYHETRSCAFAACVLSVAVAIAITCLEWIGVQCGKRENFQVYLDIFQLVLQQKSSKDFYSSVLSPHSNNSLDDYPCVNLSLNEASSFSALTQVSWQVNRLLHYLLVMTYNSETWSDSIVITAQLEIIRSSRDNPPYRIETENLPNWKYPYIVRISC